MDANKRMFRFLKYDMFKGIGVFWLVMLIVNTLSIVVSFSTDPNFIQGPMIIDEQSISFVSSNFFVIFIVFVVYSIEMYFESFSLAIGFGGSRRRFYLNVIINNIMMVLIFATVQMILLKLEYYIISNSIHKPITEFGWFNTAEDNILSIVFSLSFIFLALLSITNLIGVLQYRFGYKFWVSLGIFVLFIQMTINGIGRLIGGFIDYITHLGYVIPTSNIIGVGFLIILLAYSIGFLVIRKVNIK